MKFNLIQAAIELFYELKQKFTITLMLKHYDLDKKLLLEINVSVFAIFGILLQLGKLTG